MVVAFSGGRQSLSNGQPQPATSLTHGWNLSFHWQYDFGVDDMEELHILIWHKKGFVDDFLVEIWWILKESLAKQMLIDSVSAFF